MRSRVVVVVVAAEDDAAGMPQAQAQAHAYGRGNPRSPAGAMNASATKTPQPGTPAYRGPRDALTGAPLDLGAIARGETPVYVVRDWTARDPRPVPLQINRNVVDDGGGGSSGYGGGSHPARRDRTLGGLLWSPAFGRFIRDALPGAVDAERAGLAAWYVNDYVVGRLQTQVASDPRAAVQLAAVLAVYRDGAELLTVADTMNVPWERIRAWQRSFQRRARPYYPRREAPTPLTADDAEADTSTEPEDQRTAV